MKRRRGMCEAVPREVVTPKLIDRHPRAPAPPNTPPLPLCLPWCKCVYVAVNTVGETEILGKHRELLKCPPPSVPPAALRPGGIRHWQRVVLRTPSCSRLSGFWLIFRACERWTSAREDDPSAVTETCCVCLLSVHQSICDAVSWCVQYDRGKSILSLLAWCLRSCLMQNKHRKHFTDQTHRAIRRSVRVEKLLN